MSDYKNLIFDLGEIIVDIDYRVTLAEFQKLAVVDFSEVLSYSHQYPVFDLLEKGKISPAEFRNGLRKFLKPGVTDEEIDRAWNSMMVHYPEEKFALLKELKTRYKTFALSNTNAIHVAAIDEVARKKFGSADFAGFFHHAYYSHETGFRKPEKEIFEYVLEKEKLIAKETFFVDDKEENVAVAQSLGIQAYRLKERDKLFELLKELNVI